MSGRVGFTKDSGTFRFKFEVGPIEFLNLFTLSRFPLHGMSSSGEFLGSPHTGQVFSSDSIRAFRAHSSHISQAHSGIIMQSLRRSLHTGQIRSDGISTFGVSI